MTGNKSIMDLPKSEFESHFDSPEQAEREYARMRLGLKMIDDAILDLGTLKKTGRVVDKNYILSALGRRDLPTLRQISNQFYEISGIYRRACEYQAQIYRYDWYITPYLDKDKKQESKLLNDFSKILQYMDNSEIKRLLNFIALEVMKNGSYYGIIVDLGKKFTIQQLPCDYCRSRFTSGLDPVVELNMKFFDSCFSNPQFRLRILQTFPKDVQKAYVLYKEGKLKGDFPGDGNGWWVIDPGLGVKITLNNSDFPPLVQAIPSIIDLDEAQGLDKKKMMQQLLKIIIQKLPLNKDDELIFDLEEAQDIHNNTVAMLKRAIGVDVMTTFADVSVADMADKNTATTKDDLERVERTVFNNFATSQNLFNTEGNVALEKSVLNDEASVKDFVLQFEALLNKVVDKFSRAGHYTFRASMLETTIYNYRELSKMYKEMVQIGYSKMLPQLALGHSQSSIIASATFENNILHLADIMIPPMMSSTMSSKPSGGNNNSNQNQNKQQPQQTQQKQDAGRPEKENDQKSEKTIANRSAMGKEG